MGIFIIRMSSIIPMVIFRHCFVQKYIRENYQSYMLLWNLSVKH